MPPPKPKATAVALDRVRRTIGAAVDAASVLAASCPPRRIRWRGIRSSPAGKASESQRASSRSRRDLRRQRLRSARRCRRGGPRSSRGRGRARRARRRPSPRSAPVRRVRAAAKASAAARVDPHRRRGRAIGEGRWRRSVADVADRVAGAEGDRVRASPRHRRADAGAGATVGAPPSTAIAVNGPPARRRAIPEAGRRRRGQPSPARSTSRREPRRAGSAAVPSTRRSRCPMRRRAHPRAGHGDRVDVVDPLRQGDGSESPATPPRRSISAAVQRSGPAQGRRRAAVERDRVAADAGDRQRRRSGARAATVEGRPAADPRRRAGAATARRAGVVEAERGAGRRAPRAPSASSSQTSSGVDAGRGGDADDRSIAVAAQGSVGSPITTAPPRTKQPVVDGSDRRAGLQSSGNMRSACQMSSPPSTRRSIGCVEAAGGAGRTSARETPARSPRCNGRPAGPQRVADAPAGGLTARTPRRRCRSEHERDARFATARRRRCWRRRSYSTAPPSRRSVRHCRSAAASFFGGGLLAGFGLAAGFGRRRFGSRPLSVFARIGRARAPVVRAAGLGARIGGLEQRRRDDPGRDAGGGAADRAGADRQHLGERRHPGPAGAAGRGDLRSAESLAPPPPGSRVATGGEARGRGRAASADGGSTGAQRRRGARAPPGRRAGSRGSGRRRAGARAASRASAAPASPSQKAESSGPSSAQRPPSSLRRGSGGSAPAPRRGSG